MVIEIITAVLAGIGALISAVDALLSHIFSDSKHQKYKDGSFLRSK